MKPDTKELRAAAAEIHHVTLKTTRERDIPALMIWAADELERECVWQSVNDATDNALYTTACQRLVYTLVDDGPDRPCWCGGKVKVQEKGDE